MSNFELKPATRQGEIPIPDLTGRRFVRLVVQSFRGFYKSHPLWNCICDCGSEVVTRRDSLMRGLTKSCGCLRADRNRERETTHGMTYTNTYRKWRSMKGRCRLNATGKARKNYVERGITICPRWLNSFENFFADMGECPAGMEIERKNNDGNYEPLNCKWSTRLENQHNRRVSINISFRGKTQTLKQWAEELGLHYVTLIYRIKTGWPVEMALTTPGRKCLK